MGYYLHVWNADRAISTREMIDVFDIAEEFGEDSAEFRRFFVPHARAETFADELFNVYPQLLDLPEDKRETSPWNGGIEVTNYYIDLGMVYPAVKKAADTIFKLCRKHDLSLYDSQTSIVYPADRVVNTTEVAVESPWIFGNMPASKEFITDLVNSFDGRKKEEPYLILNIDDEVYMQTKLTKKGYTLEYRDGDFQKHFVVSKPLTPLEVIEVLSDYALRNDTWRSQYEFDQMMF